MPVDQDDPNVARTHAYYRHRLIEASETVDVDVEGVTARVSCLPLFRESPGGLQQAIRVRLSPTLSIGALRMRLERDGHVIDEARAEPISRHQSLLLFVDEVTEPEAVQLVLEPDGGERTESTIVVTPQRKWTLHLIHHSHYDIGYTDPQTDVMASQLSYLDYALDLCTATDDWPDSSRFRWNIEVNWPLKEWLRTRPKSDRNHLLRRIDEGRIEVHALPFSMHTEAYSHDELGKQLDFAQELRERWNIPIVSAMQTDVPGATIGLSSLLTDAGIRYFSVAHNYAGRSIPHLTDGQKLTRPFYWEAPDGEKLLVWYTDTLFGIAYMEAMTLGFGSSYDDVVGSLPEYLGNLARSPYPYGEQGDWMIGDLSGVELTKAPYAHDILSMRLQGKFGDNASPSLLPSEIVRRWNDEWAYPKLQTSVNHQFFTEIESTIGDHLDTFSGDWTDWWADGIGSGAIPLAKNRQSQSDIRTAQSLHALSDAVTDEPKKALARDVQSAYEHMALFDEHTWGAANPWDKLASGMSSGELEWTRKAAFAYTAEEQVRTLLDGGLRRFAPLAVSNPESTSVVVFNPSSHSRTDLVSVFVPERSLGDIPVAVREASSGQPVAMMIDPQVNETHRPIGTFVRFLARDVPAFGYARYEVETGPRSGAQPANVPVVGDGESVYLDNGMLHVGIELASGAVRSLKASGAELVAPHDSFGLNGCIFDQYTSAPKWNHLSSRIGRSDPWLLGQRSTGIYGHIVRSTANDIWQQVTVRFEGSGTDWIESTYTLPHDVPRLHVVNHLHKPAAMEKESLYFAYPFNLTSPDISYHITGGVVKEGDDRVPGSANYFRAIRDWVTLADETGPRVAWATTDAPLIQRGAIHLPYAPFAESTDRTETSDATIYSWALNNIWDTNFPPSQGGEMMFRYTVATPGDDQQTAYRLGTDTGDSATLRLVGVVANGGTPAVPGTPDRGSFARVDHAEVRISHMAAARNGDGLAIVLVSEAQEPVEVTLMVEHLPFNSARVGTFWETNMEDAPRQGNGIAVTINPGEMKTVVLDQ
jgi:hypothetical protein